MKFEQIFENDGLYKSDSFAKGVAIKIANNGSAYLTTYSKVNDLNPLIHTLLVYKGLFEKDYKKVFTIKELF